MIDFFYHGGEMTITQMKYVLAVDEYRHFKRASIACHISQPTLSMQIQKLEDSLGIIIFDRSKSPTLRTREGEIFIKQARVVVNEYRKIDALLKEGNQKLSGEFKLAVIPTLAPFLIPLFASKFNSKYPKVKLIIEERKTEEIIDLLASDLIDAGLLVTPLKNDKIIERTLYFEPFSIYTSAETIYFKKKKIRESSLSMDNIWLLNKGNCFRDQVLNLCQYKEKKDSENANLVFQSGSLETLKNMVDLSGGYTILPQMMLNKLSIKDKKKVREFEEPCPIREVSLVHSRIFLKEKIIDALEKEILQKIPPELQTFKKKSHELVDVF
ncbi:MAG: LysR family transcriptional regulator [Bacteriovoracaceae bacterium]|jgi:LysR family transcriptional regulator, hydrogen peroxide-inducible genes activator|nr:LysR family transcriptional regulator [Bacteriovoracaceae bacterium]